MAKRSFNRKARTLQSAVMKLHFAIPVTGTGDSINYIDISSSVSRLCRRFYRQGLNWAVANVKVTQLQGTVAASGSTCYVNTIPHTWSVSNAWKKSYGVWKKQQDEALAASESMETAARFRDFKIRMEHTHVFADTLSPFNLGPGRTVGPFQTGLLTNGPVAAAEEWLSSQIVIPNDGAPGVTAEYTMHMVGPDVTTSKGMIQGYADSRDRPQSPDPDAPIISQGWMQEMFDVGGDSSQVTDNAQFRNDELPYDQDAYPGGGTNLVELETQGYNWNQSTVGVNTFNTGPFTAPCGLIRIDFLNQAELAGSTNQNIVTIELVPGTHRGYLCETMEEF